MSTLVSIVLANISLSFVSMSGLVALLAVAKKNFDRYIFLLVSISAGTLLGGAFLHLLPEAAETQTGVTPFAVTLAAYIGFFLLEKLIHYRHCHTDHCDEHQSFGYINLVGDGIHNFIDGIIIAAAFLTDVHLGWVTTFAVLLHEIPQEVGDLGVLLHSGFSRQRAIVANLGISLASLVGGVFAYVFASYAGMVAEQLLPVAAGSFLYLASSDLIPEIRKENHQGRFAVSLLFVCIGIGIMAIFTLFE